MKLSAFLIIFMLPIYLVAQGVSVLDFSFENQNPETVLKNGRLELGLDLPEEYNAQIQEYLDGKPHQRTGLNPFVSWDINVYAMFRHLETGTVIPAIGFYFTDIKRNSRENKWEELPTKNPFRIRFAPSMTGKWEVAIFVNIKDKPVFKSNTTPFTVVDSDYKGFVTVNSKTKYLERDGKTIVLSGINLPFPINYNNMLYSLKKEDRLEVKAWENFHWLVNDYIQRGGEYFRFFMHPSASDIEFEEVGYYQSRQNQAWEIDQIVNLCEQTNTLMNFDILFHQISMVMGDYSQLRYDYTDFWGDPNAWPYKDPNEISGYSYLLNSKQPSDMFLESAAIEYLKQRTRYIMARWGYSTSLAIVELASEPWHINENPQLDYTPYNEVSELGDITRKAAYNYHKEISNYIKDTLNQRQHLIGAVGAFPMGLENIYSHSYSPEMKELDSTWFLNNIDIIVISFYSEIPEKLIISKGDNKNNECGKGENSMRCSILRLNEIYGKPVMFGESDHGGASRYCSNFEGHKVDIMRYIYTGAVGHHVWAAYEYEKDEKGNVIVDERVIWDDLIKAKDYYNEEWFTNLLKTREVIGLERNNAKGFKKPAVETQYIIGNNRELAGGYIYNRTYNISTMAGKSFDEIAGTPCNIYNDELMNPTEIDWKPKRLKVEGLLPNKKYKVTFYNYTDYSPLEETTMKSSISGKLTLKHPILKPVKSGTPLIWYRIELE